MAKIIILTMLGKFIYPSKGEGYDNIFFWIALIHSIKIMTIFVIVIVIEVIKFSFGFFKRFIK